MADDTKQAEAPKAETEATTAKAKVAADDQANTAGHQADKDPAPSQRAPKASKATSRRKSNAGGPAAAEADPQLEGDYVMIVAQRPRRRAGYRFGPTPLRVPVADLNDEQRAAILADPHLSIQQPD